MRGFDGWAHQLGLAQQAHQAQCRHGAEVHLLSSLLLPVVQSCWTVILMPRPVLVSFSRLATLMLRLSNWIGREAALHARHQWFAEDRRSVSAIVAAEIRFGFGAHIDQ